MRVLIRNLRSDEHGVASTVGTMMALLVFLTFLSLIVNQYVPVWMQDAEAAHANGALGQFGTMKGAIDLQVLSALAAKSDYVPVTASTPVTLGTEGVPIFATPTAGSLFIDPDAGSFTVAFDYSILTPSGAELRVPVREQSNGSITLDIPNRFSAPQRIVYENGAVIRYQNDGQVIRAQPTFLVARTDNTIRLGFQLVSLYGSGRVSGTNTEVVNSRMYAIDRQTYNRFPGDAVIRIDHTSAYGRAWYTFFNSTLAATLDLGGTFSSTPLDMSYTARAGGLVIYKVSVSYIPTRSEYVTRLEIRNNPGVLALGSFHLEHAQVQIGIGDSPENALR